MKQENNRTELQEALECVTNGIFDAPKSIRFMNKHYGVDPSILIVKAAQAYADLPEKIEGMKYNWKIKKTESYEMRAHDKALDDILNLLKEEV